MDATETVRTLAGLPPDLVVDLAGLFGATRRDLDVVVQVMPAGHVESLVRAGWLARDDGRSRLVVRPGMTCAVQAALSVVVRAADPAAVARVLDRGPAPSGFRS